MHLPRKIKIIFPILIGIYPVIFLIAENIREIEPLNFVLLRPIIVSLLFSVVVWFLSNLLFKDVKRSAIFSSLLLLLFYSYGHVYNFFYEHHILNFNAGRHIILGPVYIILLAFIIRWGVKKIEVSDLTIRFINLAMIGLFILPVYKLVDFTVFTLRSNSTRISLDGQLLFKPESGELPDIYYIILDTYGRNDTIQACFGYDNSPFTKLLEDMGFYVAHESKANFNSTIQSVTTSMNMAYPRRYEQNELVIYLRSNKVMGHLKELGYKIVSFETGFPNTEIKNVDQYMAPSWDPSWITPYESYLINSTAWRIFSDTWSSLNPASPPLLDFASTLSSNQIHVRRQLFLLNQLKRMPSQVSPKFVYAHIMIPHPPFSFSKDGVLDYPLGNENYKTAYVGQVEYINQQMLQILSHLISDSKVKPIIVLQGDHGFEGKEYRLSEILNAYYFPDQKTGDLYPTISPVNSFRVIFNHFFDAQYPILPDKYYYWDDPSIIYKPFQQSDCKP